MRRKHVVQLPVDAREPGRLLFAKHLRKGPLDVREVMREVASSHPLRVGRLVQALERVLANRVEQVVPLVVGLERDQ